MTDTTDLVAVKDRLPANLRRQPGERARDYLLRRLAVAKVPYMIEAQAEIEALNATRVERGLPASPFGPGLTFVPDPAVDAILDRFRRADEHLCADLFGQPHCSICHEGTHRESPRPAVASAAGRRIGAASAGRAG